MKPIYNTLTRHYAKYQHAKKENLTLDFGNALDLRIGSILFRCIGKEGIFLSKTRQIEMRKSRTGQ